MISITKKFEFEAAHSLGPREVFGKCANLHGHTYKLEIEVSPNATELLFGMIMNFSDLKKIVNEEIIDKLDHTFLNESIHSLKKLAPYASSADDEKADVPKLTAEFMVLCFVATLTETLPMNVKLVRVRLYETSNSFAEWKQ